MADSKFEGQSNLNKIPPDHVGVMIVAVIMMIGGWVGLYQLVTTVRPYVGPRWLFMVLLFIAVAGTALPFIRYLNVRFTPIHRELPPGGVIVRQSVWVSLFVVVCVWLQILRTLSLPIAFFLGLAFTVIEIFLRSREFASEYEE